jgi:hypothetical protein
MMRNSFVLIRVQRKLNFTRLSRFLFCLNFVAFCLQWGDISRSKRLVETKNKLKLIFGNLFSAVLVCAAFVTCMKPKLPQSAAVYYWKMDHAPDSISWRWLVDNQVERLYLHMADFDAKAGQIQTTAVLAKFEKPDYCNVEIVPVVFLTQPALHLLRQTELNQLAAQIVKILPQSNELQIDADWTANTEIPYFELLKAIRAKMKAKTLSCTLRLHQWADKKSGTPPTDRVMLLPYHTGDLNNPDETQTIFSAAELKKWLGKRTNYPLPLDNCLPTYGWTRLFRDGKFIRLLPDIRDAQPLPEAHEPIKNGFRITKTTWWAEQPLYPDDILLPDTVSTASLDSALQQFFSISNGGFRAFYHLDKPLIETPKSYLDKWWGRID